MQMLISETDILFLPQRMFFTKSFVLQDAMTDSEIKDFARTKLEEASPFSSELLKWAYIVDKDRGEVLVYGACMDQLMTLRRTISHMELSENVLPVCALLFKLKLPDGVSVFKRKDRNSKNEFIAVKIEGGKWQDLIAADFEDSVSDEVALKKLSDLASFDCSTKLNVLTFAKNVFGKITVSSEDKLLKSVQFGKDFFEQADVRELTLMRKVKKQLAKNRMNLMAFYASFVVLLTLLLWNISFVFQRSSLENKRVEFNTLELESKTIAKMRDDASFINSLLSKKMHNTMMLARLNKFRPDGILFLKSSALSPTKMEVKGSAPSVSRLNAFERALKTSNEFKSVSIKTSGVTGTGAMWTLVVEFKK